MFELYTEKARRVIFFARYEASHFGSPLIESEHMLLGLLRECKGSLDLYLPELQKRAAIPKRIEEHTTIRERISTSVDLPLSDECKRILAHASEEAELLGHRHIGTEHLLLGLLREEGCFGAQLMRECGADLELARKKLAEAPVISASPQQVRQGQFEGSSNASYTEEVIERFIAQKLSDSASEQPGFEKYTDLTRLSMYFSKFEAIKDGSETVKTEHLLRGLLRLPSGDCYRFLPHALSWSSVCSNPKIRDMSRMAPSVVGQLPFSEECKQAMEFAQEEAVRLQHDKIAVEHLLLGLLRVEESAASKIMRENGADLEQLQQKLADAAPLTKPQI